MVTDPISDLIIRLKNASEAKKAKVVISYSKLNENIVNALKHAGFIQGIEKKGKQFSKELEISFGDFQSGAVMINGVERISKPSKRVYLKHGDIRTFRSGYGHTVFSTPKGILIDQDAKRLKVGGEVLFKIW